MALKEPMNEMTDPDGCERPRPRRSAWVRWLGFVALLLALPIALFALAVPPNEYKAQGIDAVDCDGPIGVYLFAIPALLIYGAGAIVNGRRYRHRLNASVSAVCILLCLLITVSIGRAYKEQALMTRDDPLACK